MHNKSKNIFPNKLKAISKTKIISVIIILLVVLAALINMMSNNKEVNLPLYDYERYYEKILFKAETIENTDNEKTFDNENLSLYAGSAVIIDARDGHILYGKNPFEQRAIASTTKIITAIIALENTKGDEIVEISKNAANSPKVRLGVKAGEQYYLRDLMYSMMLESHNDSAVAIAEYISGSVEEFAVLMNNKAKEIEADSSSFVTPNGLDAEMHYSTAYDMAIIGAYAMKNEKFYNLVNTRQHSFSEINGKAFHSLYNINNYLNIDSTAIGIKTGFTGKAGFCFVGANTYGNTRIISTVLASGWPPDKTFKWCDMKTLVNYVHENFSEIELSVDEYIFSVPTNNSSFMTINISDFSYELLHSDKETITQIICIKPFSDNNDISTCDVADSKFKYIVEGYLFYGNVKQSINEYINIK